MITPSSPAGDVILRSGGSPSGSRVLVFGTLLLLQYIIHTTIQITMTTNATGPTTAPTIHNNEGSSVAVDWVVT